MSRKLRKILKEEYNRLKKGFDKLFKPRSSGRMPNPALQPVRNRKVF